VGPRSARASSSALEGTLGNRSPRSRYVSLARPESVRTLVGGPSDLLPRRAQTAVQRHRPLLASSRAAVEMPGTGFAISAVEAGDGPPGVSRSRPRQAPRRGDWIGFDADCEHGLCGGKPSSCAGTTAPTKIPRGLSIPAERGPDLEGPQSSAFGRDGAGIQPGLTSCRYGVIPGPGLAEVLTPDHRKMAAAAQLRVANVFSRRRRQTLHPLGPVQRQAPGRGGSGGRSSRNAIRPAVRGVGGSLSGEATAIGRPTRPASIACPCSPTTTLRVMQLLRTALDPPGLLPLRGRSFRDAETLR